MSSCKENLFKVRFVATILDISMLIKICRKYEGVMPLQECIRGDWNYYTCILLSFQLRICKCLNFIWIIALVVLKLIECISYTWRPFFYLYLSLLISLFCLQEIQAYEYIPWEQACIFHLTRSVTDMYTVLPEVYNSNRNVVTMGGLLAIILEASLHVLCSFYLNSVISFLIFTLWQLELMILFDTSNTST